MTQHEDYAALCQADDERNQTSQPKKSPETPAPDVRADRVKEVEALSQAMYDALADVAQLAIAAHIVAEKVAPPRIKEEMEKGLLALNTAMLAWLAYKGRPE